MEDATLIRYFTPECIARLPSQILLSPGVTITNPALFVRAQLARMGGKPGAAQRIAEHHIEILMRILNKK